MRHKFAVRGTRTPGIKNPKKRIGCPNREMAEARIVANAVGEYIHQYGLKKAINTFGLNLVEIKVFNGHMSDLQKRVTA